ncbi:MAG TPA: bifunctional YncE family protein/alkaline phosphatase family protein [Candidatus Paceibacterota bacterium]|nr:bifunctional YncE family protein/alkaline phosphatase family protein [Verrucomicrobiota bacterium]HRY46882.1 bifunctional YncE family protein/alkaline phosphatase family protein [Candidatus Paceibacterota bacterium]
MNAVKNRRRTLWVGFVLAALLIAGTILAKGSQVFLAPPDAVGRVAANRYRLPTGQLLTPAGWQVELPGMRPQAMALSPDGRRLALAGKTNKLVLIDPRTGRIRQSVSLAAATNQVIQPRETNTVAATNLAAPRMSLTGLVFSPDGRALYLADASGRILVFPVDEKGHAGSPMAFLLPDARTPKPKTEIPAGLAVSADGHRLYVAASLGNRLHELDTATGRVIRSWETGVAPYDVVLAPGKAYVSNQGGRRPGKGDVTASAGQGTQVRVDPARQIASEGSVTVIDLDGGVVKTEILVEQHASAMAVSPDFRYLVVANTGSDTLSVVDTTTDQVVEKIWTRQTPADLFGAQPNAVAFDRRGRQLFVCNGTQNAVAVIRFDPRHNASKVTGLIPVGWFPGAVVLDRAGRSLCIANIKGIGSGRVVPRGGPVKSSSKDYYGTLSLVPIPSKQALTAMTRIARRNMSYDRLAESALPPRPGQPPRPVPERVGEPSVFKHVIYVIKENRTYDQILGDMPEGNGSPALCTFGELYTPNQHKMAREFVLLDNTYCAGIVSADGHQWTDSAIANAYMERQLTSSFPRSYPGGKSEDGLDALAWASSGFIWDNALAHGKTFRNYGEWMISEAHWKDRAGHKDKPTWQDFWQDHTTGSNLTRLASRAGIKSLRPHSATDTVGWDLNVPDVMRAARFIQDLRAYESKGDLPNLIILFLPNDHTGGTRGTSPTPGAQVADNDLALGQVVEALSRSRFWPETCLFAIEDDPQAGWDHVSGYRTTCYVASPYTKRRQTISTQYNQTSVIRTLELMLGLPPMNQMDATATPMRDCFTDTPDFTPFLSVTNRVPLDATNPNPKTITDRRLREDAMISAQLPLDEVDRCPEDVLNRILWRAMKGPDTPYPEWAVKAELDD